MRPLLPSGTVTPGNGIARWPGAQPAAMPVQGIGAVLLEQNDVSGPPRLARTLDHLRRNQRVLSCIRPCSAVHRSQALMVFADRLPDKSTNYDVRIVLGHLPTPVRPVRHH